MAYLQGRIIDDIKLFLIVFVVEEVFEALLVPFNLRLFLLGQDFDDFIAYIISNQYQKFIWNSKDFFYGPRSIVF